jgi:hypothetical protein
VALLILNLSIRLWFWHKLCSEVSTKNRRVVYTLTHAALAERRGLPTFV